jgi:hypothetical protein
VLNSLRCPQCGSKNIRRMQELKDGWWKWACQDGRHVWDMKTDVPVDKYGFQVKPERPPGLDPYDDIPLW